MDFDRIKEFEKIITEMLDIYKKKNANYGNSFGKAFEELGPISGVTRLYDKMNRIIALTKGTENNYESLEDTFIDMANYAIMNLIEMRYQTTKTNETKDKIKKVLENVNLLTEIELEDGKMKTKNKNSAEVGDRLCYCQIDS